MIMRISLFITIKNSINSFGIKEGFTEVYFGSLVIDHK
jgi:hypothetical protein